MKDFAAITCVTCSQLKLKMEDYCAKSEKLT